MSDTAARARASATEPMTEPWQGRAVALAVETVRGLGLDWDDFRRELIAALADEPHRAYYESWLVALQRLVATHDADALDDLDEHRADAASYRVGDDLDVFPLALDAAATDELLGAGAAARVRHIELHRRRNHGKSNEWRLCAFDARGESIVDQPLELHEWDELRRRHLALPPDPADRGNG